MKQLVAFDLDGTLAASKQALDDDMAGRIAGLLAVAKVAVISGGDWPQFEKQVASRLPADANVANFFLMPTTGTKLYRNTGEGWTAVYAELFSDDERQRIEAALKEGREQAGLANEKTWGPQIEDRGSQMTFSGLGQEAPIEAKEAWDPDRTKRRAIQKIMQEKLPELSINVGGSTSIDITRKGVDKAYGLQRLAEHSGVPLSGMIFCGDAIYPGGNDYPPLTIGVDCLPVKMVDDTRIAIEAMRLALKP